MLAACVSDVRSLRIPDVYSIVVIAAFIPAFLLSPEIFGRWWEHMGALALMFILTYVMFCYGVMGGGDSKFGSALALWVGLKGLVPYVLFMGIMGGVVALASYFIKKKKPFKNPRAGSWVAEVQQGRNAVPYGVAISFGAWMAILHTGIIDHQIHELIKIIH